MVIFPITVLEAIFPKWISDVRDCMNSGGHACDNKLAAADSNHIQIYLVTKYKFMAELLVVILALSLPSHLDVQGLGTFPCVVWPRFRIGQ